MNIENEIKWLRQIAKIVDNENKEDHLFHGKKTIRKYIYGDALLNKLGGIEAVIKKLELENAK